MGKSPEFRRTTETRDTSRTELEFLQEEQSPKGGQRGSIQSRDEDEREREQGGNIPGQDQIGVGRSCVRMGSDTNTAPSFFTFC